MDKIKVLITDGISKEGLEILKNHPDFEIDLRRSTPAMELAEIIGKYDCIVVRSATTLSKTLIDKASTMKLIVRAGTGVDNIDVAAATERGIPVANTASANSLATAEMTIALMFAAFRSVAQASNSLREGRWDRNSFKGYEVTGKTLAVIGIGNIGRIVAEKAIGLGMNVVGYDPKYPTLDLLPAKLSQPVNPLRLAPSLDEAVQGANIITVHVPKNQETMHLINAERIAKLKDKSFLLNIARGGIVDEKAVLAALDSGKLAGAAFDVFEEEPPKAPNPLFSHPKVVCVPHLGASTFEAQERVAVTAVNHIINFFTRGERSGIINL